MYQNIKDNYHNLRRHKIMVTLIILLSVASYYLFTWNYRLTSPVVRRDSPVLQDIQNDLADCTSENYRLTSKNLSQGLPADISEQNKEALAHWNDPAE